MTRDQKIYRLAYWISAALVAVALLSGYPKIVDPASFAVSVYRFHLLPGFMVNAVALYLPWLEMVCGLSLLVIPRLRSAALWLALALLVLFTGAIAVNVWRGSAFGCGCFGRAGLDEPLGVLHLLRNAGLTALCALGLLAGKKAQSSQER